MTRKTKTSRFRPPSIATRNRRAGFTLIELAVALTIVLMIVTMVVPTIARMIESRASMEAFNLIAAQLSASRAEAIASDTYAGVHVQLDYQTDMAEKTAYSMIIAYDEANSVFKRPDLFMPQQLPGKTALGQLTSDFVTAADPGTYYNLSTDDRIETFCAFSVIFSPDGSIVTHVKGGNVMFASNDPMFIGAKTRLWNFEKANNKPGVTAFTMFDYLELLKRESAARINYLNENGQFLPVNMHTGQLFDRH
ncbi:MAG: prepilin-type N-terminal cleavage/methylation domain-containing protein [Phycisphaerae bacterium]|jgi:prepilin-type N-terminal cleavage/methylation domain-containing protein|nr:prepilin-type N-terminal cleavage/methylation domain-containing protein [Phycisphaerae bacterium]